MGDFATNQMIPAFEDSRMARIMEAIYRSAENDGRLVRFQP